MALGKSIRELGVKISLIFDQKKAEEAHKRVEKMAEGLKEVGFHVAEASAALLGLAKIESGHARSLEESSKQLGINVEALQELQYAAKVQAGVGAEELNGALTGLSKTLFEARNNGGEAARTLIRLGVPLEMLQDKSVTADKVLLNLSDTFKTMPDGMYKTGLAAAAGGESFVKLLPLLDKGAKGIAQMGVEGRKLGVILDEGMIKRGVEFDKSFERVFLVLKNITFLIGDELIKNLEPVILAFQQFIVQNRKFIATGIAAVVKSLADYLKIIFVTVGFVAKRFQFLVGVLGGVERVAKVIAVAMGIFTAAKLISGLGTLLTSLRAVFVVLSGIEVEALAIAAGFLALVLVIQDLFSDDSIIKEWFRSFEDKFPIIKEMVEWFTHLADVVGNMGMGLNKAASFIGGIKDGIGAISNLKLADLNPFASAQATASPQAQAQANNQNTQNNQMQANITVQVPPGTSPKDATNIVSGGVQEGFDSLMRSTRNQAIGGAAY